MDTQGFHAARFEWLESGRQRLRSYIREFSIWADKYADFMESRGGRLRIAESRLKPFVRTLRQYVKLSLFIDAAKKDMNLLNGDITTWQVKYKDVTAEDMLQTAITIFGKRWEKWPTLPMSLYNMARKPWIWKGKLKREKRSPHHFAANMDLHEELRVATDLTQDCVAAHAKRKELCTFLHDHMNWPIGLLLGDGRPSLHEVTVEFFPLHHSQLVELSNEVTNKKHQVELILSRIAESCQHGNEDLPGPESQEHILDLLIEQSNVLSRIVSEWQYMGKVWGVS